MDEGGAALVVLTQAGQALVEVGVPAGVGVCVAQFHEESDGLVVGGGLLGGDVRLDLLPDAFGLVCEGGQVLGAGRGLVVFGALSAFVAQSVSGVQEVGGGPAPRDGSGGGSAAQTVQEFGARLGLRAEGEPQEQGVLLLLREGFNQWREFLLRGPGRLSWAWRAGLGRGCEQIGIDA